MLISVAVSEVMSCLFSDTASAVCADVMCFL